MMASDMSSVMTTVRLVPVILPLDQAEDTEATRLADKKTVESGRKTLEETRDVVARMTNDVGNAL